MDRGSRKHGHVVVTAVRQKRGGRQRSQRLAVTGRLGVSGQRGWMDEVVVWSQDGTSGPVPGPVP